MEQGAGRTEKELRQLQRRSCTRSAPGVSLRYLCMSSGRPIHTRNWAARFRGWRWKSARRALRKLQKYGPLAEEQLERKAKVQGLLVLVSTAPNGTKCMEFVNRDFNAAINIRRCAVLEKRPPDWTQEDFIGQPLKVELYEKKWKQTLVAGPKKRGGVCTSVGDPLPRARSPLLYTAGGNVCLLRGVRCGRVTSLIQNVFAKST